MPLHIDPPYDPKATYAKHPERRVWCDGCGVSVVVPSEKWTFPPQQVQDWYDEHKDHKAPKSA